MEAMHVAEAEAKDKAHQEAAAKMEAMHVAEAEAKDKAHQEAAAQMEAMHVAEAEAKDKAHQEAAAKMEAMHVAEAEAKDKASQEGSVHSLLFLFAIILTIYQRQPKPRQSTKPDSRPKPLQTRPLQMQRKRNTKRLPLEKPLKKRLLRQLKLLPKSPLHRTLVYLQPSPLLQKPPQRSRQLRRRAPQRLSLHPWRLPLPPRLRPQPRNR